MFFIFGISEKEKPLPFEQTVFCSHCGKWGRVTILVRYSCFMLFFIPLIKWNKRYSARMECCQRRCTIDDQLGRQIEYGAANAIRPEDLHFDPAHMGRQCAACGFFTTEDFVFCPRCGRSLPW